MSRYIGEKREWGRYVYVKENLLSILTKEIRRVRRGTVLLSSVTDPYQPIENELKLTRECIRLLNRGRFRIVVQTKSNLVVRDLDLLSGYNNEAGITVTVLDEEVRKAFEPFASKPIDRFKALEEIVKSKVNPYLFIAPILPIYTLNDIEEIFKLTSEIGVDRVLIDKLNLKAMNWRSIKQALLKLDPEMLSVWEKILFRDRDYFQRIKSKIFDLSERYSLHVEFCY